MAYPPGISLAVIQAGKAGTFFGDAASLTATVTPVLSGTKYLVHSATGDLMVPSPQTFTAQNDSVLSFSVPHVDQPGYMDDNATPYTMWAYKVDVTVLIGNGRQVKKHTWTKNFQPLVGQDFIDIDQIASGTISEGVTAPLPEILSVNGQTGHVTIDSGADDAGIATLVHDESSAMRSALSEKYASQFTADSLTTTADVNVWLATPSDGVKRLAGNLTITGPLVVPSDTHLDATGATITLAPGTGGNMLQNTAVAATATQDTNIRITGGTWVRGENGGVGRDLHSLVFRRVDGLHVDGVTVDTNAGKYCISVAALTNFRITNSTFVDTFSDGIHIQGPASNGVVEGVRGRTHDDSVAITGNDYETYSDVFGDVTNVLIRDVHTTSVAANVVKVLAGEGCKVDDITVQKVRGTASQHGVWLGDDNGQPRTDNGVHGRLIVRDVEVEGGQATSCQVFTNFANGARELIVEDAVLRRGLGTFVVKVGSELGVDTLRIIRPVVEGMAAKRVLRLEGGAGTYVRVLEIASPVMHSTGGITALIDTGNKLNNVTITNPHLTTPDTNDTRWIYLGGGSPDSLTISGGYISGGRDILDLNTGGAYTFTGGLAITGVNRIANLFSGTPTITFGECTIVSTINNWIMLNSGAVGVNVVGGDNTTVNATSNMLQRSSGAQTYRVNGRRLKASILDLSPVVGDQVTALFTLGSVPAGHPVVYTGTEWKQTTAAQVSSDPTVTSAVLSAEQLSNLASTHRQAASAEALIDYQDSLNFREEWAGLTAWSSSTFGQVSGGRLFSANQGGGSGANHAFPVPAGADFRAVFNVRTVNGLTGGGLIVGVSRDAAGAAATAGAAASRGLYFRGDVATMNNGTATQITGAGRLNAGVDDTAGSNRDAEWIVTVSGDSAYVSAVARVVGSNVEYRARWVRDDATFPINNLYVFNSDSRQLTGHSVGFLGARISTATVTPRTGVEGVARTVQWTTVNGARIRCTLPVNYDSRKPSPLVIMHHGYTSDETHWQNNANGEAVASAFTNAGYIVLSAANDANINTWASPAGLAAYKTAYDWCRARFNIGAVVAYGNSMGGLESLVGIGRGTIPGIVAWIGTVPVSSLSAAHASTDFQASVRTAYGVAADGSDYATKTAGHDPVLMKPAAFRGLPMWALVATDDTAVPPGQHFDVLEPILRTHAAELVRVNVTGGHSTGQITSRAGEMVAFADKYAK